MSAQQVAVYGSLLSNKGNHCLLEGSKYIGTTLTPPEYTMYSLGGFPCIALEGGTPIHVEVYEVDESVFGMLDRLEGYPSFYNRKEIETELGTAWIYYISDVNYLGKLNVVTSGRWV